MANEGGKWMKNNKKRRTKLTLPPFKGARGMKKKINLHEQLK
jgi:hypothetical protein